MGLRALFNKLVPPKKIATEASGALPIKRPNKFTLQFTNMEDSPSYPLTETFVVGSEVGDVVISDPTLSPKHATFHLKNGLVSVIDNGSTEGTRLKDSLLPRGRAVILEVDDELSLGNVTIRLNGEVDESIPEPVVAEEPKQQSKTAVVEKAVAALDTSSHDADLPEEPITRASRVTMPTGSTKPGWWQRIKQKLKITGKKSSNSSSRKAMGGGVHRSANTIPRIFALMLDLVWTLIIWEIFSPIEDFMFILEIVPELLQEQLWPLVQVVAKDAGVSSILNDVVSSLLANVKDLEEEAKLSYLVSLWVSVRLVTTMLFGVSIGSFMAGIRSQDNALWKRVGGFVRELLGLVTGPFIIFDIPAIFSRKTFKEVLTFTTLHVPSKGAVVVSLMFFVPISLASLLLAPFVSGLTLPEEVIYTEKPREKRDRSKEAALAKAPVQESVVGSKWFGASFKVDTTKWWVLPRFLFQQTASGSSLKPTLIFYNQPDPAQPAVNLPLALERTFDWAKLIGPVFEHNILAHNSYPTLWRYIESTKINKNSALAFNLSESEKISFSIELQSLIATSFKLTVDNLVEHVQTYGPLLKGYLKVRSELLKLVDADGSGDWLSLMFEKTNFLMYQRPGAKPVEYYIPLVLGKGRVYSVSYGSAKERGKLSKIATRELWMKADWRNSDPPQNLSIVSVVDLLAELVQPSADERIQGQFELVYGSFYEVAASVIKLPPENIRRTSLMRTIDNTIAVLKQVAANRLKKKQPFAAEDLAKLQDKLTDLKIQLESSNAAFFGPVNPKSK